VDPRRRPKMQVSFKPPPTKSQGGVLTDFFAKHNEARYSATETGKDKTVIAAGVTTSADIGPTLSGARLGT